MDAFWIVLVGSLVGASGGLIGTFLLLQRKALVADAISHSVLPGIVVAFLIAGTRSTPLLLLGAAATGVLATLAIQWLQARGRLAADAAIGITFTGLFALGILLISSLTYSVDLDQECVLYGEIAYVPIDVYFTPDGASLGPRALWHLGPVALLVLGVLTVGYRPLQLTSFDPGYAHSRGYRPERWNRLLLVLTALLTVAAFEAVGVILVVAFLVAPAATGLLLARRLPWALFWATLTGIAAAAGGYGLATWWQASIAGSMAVAAGACAGLAIFFAPREGLLYRIRRS